MSADPSSITVLGSSKTIMFCFDSLGMLLALTIFSSSLFPEMRGIFQCDWICLIPRGICWLFQFPYGGDLAEFRDKVWLRYTSLQWSSNQSNNVCRSGQDRAVAHLDRVVDRLINKARGLLTFNSVLMAVIAFENLGGYKLASDEWVKKLHLLQTSILSGLIISSILCLELLWVRWGKVNRTTNTNIYERFADEFNQTVIICRDRAIVLNIAIMISIVCVGCILIGRFYTK